jgi:hypothetical protein
MLRPRSVVARSHGQRLNTVLQSPRPRVSPAHRVVAKRCAAQIFASPHWVQGSAPAAHRAGDYSFLQGVLVQPARAGFRVLCIPYGQPPGYPVLARLSRIRETHASGRTYF